MNYWAVTLEFSAAVWGLMLNLDSTNFAVQAAELLTAMANAKRLEILGHLLVSELSVSQIAERVDLSQSALSQHLAKLRALDLVETRRDRQSIYYSCTSYPVTQVYEALRGLYS